MMECPLTVGVWYPATIVRVIDGDTVRVVVDLGGGSTYPTNLRLAGINAPERRRQTRAAGDRSFLALVGLVAGKTARVRNLELHLDRYGRTLGDLELTPVPPAVGEGVTLAAPVMLAGGYAVPWAAAA